MYRPSSPFTTPAMILGAEYHKVNGVEHKTFVERDMIYVTAKSYGGTEREVNGRLVIEDTLQIETWYRPDITSSDHIRLLDDNSEWEIINEPENIERRNQFLKFKLRRFAGNV